MSKSQAYVQGEIQALKERIPKGGYGRWATQGRVLASYLFSGGVNEETKEYIRGYSDMLLRVTWGIDPPR